MHIYARDDCKYNIRVNSKHTPPQKPSHVFFIWRPAQQHSQDVVPFTSCASAAPTKRLRANRINPQLIFATHNIHSTRCSAGMMAQSFNNMCTNTHTNTHACSCAHRQKEASYNIYFPHHSHIKRNTKNVHSRPKSPR